MRRRRLGCASLRSRWVRSRFRDARFVHAAHGFVSGAPCSTDGARRDLFASIRAVHAVCCSIDKAIVIDLGPYRSTYACTPPVKRRVALVSERAALAKERDVPFTERHVSISKRVVSISLRASPCSLHTAACSLQAHRAVERTAVRTWRDPTRKERVVTKGERHARRNEHSVPSNEEAGP
jgi:hypothetical protein